MVDREALQSALRRIADNTLRAANDGIKATDAHNVAGVDKRISRTTSPARDAYQAGMRHMVQQVIDYAGEAAPRHTDLLEVEADRLMVELLDGHRARITAWSGKDPAVLQRMAVHLGELERPLYAAKCQAISDLTHRLFDPKATLSFWERYRSDLGFNAANTAITTVVSTVVSAGVAALVAWWISKS